MTALFRGAAGRIALDDEDFRQGWIALLAISEFAGQRGRFERGFTAGKVSCSAGRLARARRCQRFVEYGSGDGGILFEIGHELVVDHIVDYLAHLGIAEL